jgi:RHS repeat-associated protein
MVNKYAYGIFGQVIDEEEQVENPFKYVGAFGVMDEGNGTYYMRARYYDPEVGRFISNDPIGLEGGINLYAYVDSVGKPPIQTNLYQYALNNPLKYVDPLGLEAGLGGGGTGLGDLQINPNGAVCQGVWGLGTKLMCFGLSGGAGLATGGTGGAATYFICSFGTGYLGTKICPQVIETNPQGIETECPEESK